MNWPVIWRPSATRQLAQGWNDAADRNAYTAAANQIDADLERDPLNVGASRAGQRRIHIVPPLAVYYDVDVARREVIGWAVWRID
jgi:hypothetical protein